MAYFVSKIIWAAAGKVDDPHDLVWCKNSRGTGAFFIGQDCPYLIPKLFRVIRFNLPQDWERREEPVAPSGNIIIMKPDL